MISFFLAICGVALAQADTHLPEDLNVQLFHPSIDAEQTLWTDDTHLAPDGTRSVRPVLHYTHLPLGYRTQEGDWEPLVEHLMQLDLMGAWTTGPIRFGAYVPIYLRSVDANGSRTGLGDLAVDLRGSVVDRAEAPVGLAFATRLSLPTTTVDAPLGNRSIGFEGETIVDLEAGPALLAFNLGYRTAKRAELENITWNDQLFARFGAGLPVSERFGVSLDLAGHFNLFEMNRVGYPAEVLLGAWGLAAKGLTIRGGVGTGFTPGIGAPRLRVVLGIGWVSAPEPEVEPPVVVAVEPPEEVEPPEVVLPEPTPEPEPVVEEPEPVVEEPEPVFEEPEPVFEEHEPVIPPGQLVVGVFDGAGAPLPDALVSVAETDLEPVAPETKMELPPGEYTIRATLPGHLDAVRPIEVPSDGLVRVELYLAPSQVEVTAERIELSELVYFETNRADIRPESFLLLDQVASTLLDHPDLTLVRVEGHTDSRGRAEYNLDLSQRRAASVLEYLVERGVERERLQAMGFGETEPLDKRETQEAWAKNRRVDLFILERSTE
ncbi:MAG: OmpA family protein [Deltaproteobacteria bacterium]|nr:OmpA family protein [Deltaproteobacteria bacterium]